MFLSYSVKIWVWYKMDKLLKGKKNFSKKVNMLRSKKPTELTLGDRLTLLRIEGGYKNQEEFGKLFSLSKSAINNYENSLAQPGYNSLKSISEYFDVSYDYLFGVSDSKHRENHDNVNKLGVSEKSVERLIEFGESKEKTAIINYLLESELMPALVELLERFIEASILSYESIKGRSIDEFMPEVTSADYYMSGTANEKAIIYAIIHCFTDLIEVLPSVADKVITLNSPQ